MRPGFRALPMLVGALMLSAASLAPAQSRLSSQEIERVLSFGPWPPEATKDPGNRVSGDATAVALGSRLFFDARLSRVGYITCVTCHQPDRAWGDGKARAHGLADVDRNTPMLANLRLARWYGWGGASDSLWMASLRPILDEREIGSTPAHIRRLYVRDPELACWYRRAFGHAADDARDDDVTVLVNTSKALAAFQETLITGRTPFDDYRDALVRGDSAAVAGYPAAAERGLQLFIGRGNCVLCHNGPNFSNGEFHATGIGHFIGRGRADGGRFEGIEAVKISAYNLLSTFNDDTTRANAMPIRNVVLAPRNWGEFRTPSLRNVAVTAPYMHNGSLDSLRDVLRHYSDLDEERLHADGENLLRPLKLTDTEVDDLLAFLETLTDQHGADRPRPAFAPACDLEESPPRAAEPAAERISQADASRVESHTKVEPTSIDRPPVGLVGARTPRSRR
jgi:cytochrome c peroxidase